MYEHYETLWSDYKKDIDFYEKNYLPLIKHFDVAVDVGCGSGRLTRWLKKYFKKVIKIDPAQQYKNYVDHMFLDEYQGYADLILFGFHTLNYITCPKAAAAEVCLAADLVTPWFSLKRGSIIIHAAGTHNLETQIKNINWNRKFDPETHLITTIIGDKDKTTKKYYHPEFLRGLLGPEDFRHDECSDGYYVFKDYSI